MPSKKSSWLVPGVDLRARRELPGRTTIRAMNAADTPFGMRLKAQNGWNQLETDWRRLLDMQPDGCFVAEHDGVGAGTACTCVFGAVAWVAMVLVDEQLRGRGIGTALMRHVLDYLHKLGVRRIRLDATPLGRPLYEKLGFEAEYALTRFEGTMPPASPAPGVESLRESDLADICRLDQRVTGTDRARFLRRLFDEGRDRMRLVRRAGQVRGFLAARPGARAWYLGPCLGDQASARLLFADARFRYAGERVYVDVPELNPAGAGLVRELGLVPERRLVRMRLGAPIGEKHNEFWSSSGPEKG